MIRALCKKEWKKTKNTIILFAVLCLCALCFIFFNLSTLQDYNKAANALQELLSKQRIDFTYIGNFLIAFGFILSYVQYQPEVQNARIRLHLHLPLKQNFLMHFFIWYGLAIIFIFTCITNLFLFVTLITSYPIEVFYAFQTKIIVYYLLAVLAYFTVPIFLITTSKKIKIAVLLLSLLIAMIYMDYTRFYYVGETLYLFFLFIFISYYILLFRLFKTYTKGYIK